MELVAQIKIKIKAEVSVVNLSSNNKVETSLKMLKKNKCLEGGGRPMLQT